MIIGIDVREGVRPNRAGKGEYVYQLVTHLIKHAEHRFILFSDAELPTEWQLPNVQKRVWRVGSWLWQGLMVVYLNLWRPVDVYLSTTSVILPALTWRLPMVTVLFDFVSFLFADQHKSKAVLFEKIWMRPAINRSKALLSISQSTKNDAVKLFGVNPDKITVSYLGPAIAEESSPVALPATSTILFVGTLEPRKNVVVLTEAFNQLRLQGVACSLVLVGGWGWQSEEIKAAIANSPFTSDIKVLGYVSEPQKTFLYQHATVLAFPSHYEGFGMPPLEAMSLGLPVITTTASSLPEVVGDAAILVSPDSVNELTQALRRVLTDEPLRQRLAQAGLAQSQKFNWQNTADVTLGVLINARA
ncbi:glycosyltransferase family 4 protein [Patescibacteria group bacterium]|nr:glycosyltransferase family 4 protein [Patescibacteria group bacterium]